MLNKWRGIYREILRDSLGPIAKELEKPIGLFDLKRNSISNSLYRNLIVSFIRRPMKDVFWYE
jgi:hypothetical protein